MNRLLFFATIAILLGSCVNQDLLFQSPDGYTYDEIPEIDSLEYTISPNDRIEFRLLTNDGYVLLRSSSDQGAGNINNQQSMRQFGFNYLIEVDGMVKLPSLGRIKLAGYTIREAEELLEEMYSEQYRSPFVQLRVINNRVVVSPGDGGQARVIQINNTNMTVIEAIALAGGIANRGNASKVKVIREVDGEKKVFQLNLSKIESVDDAYMIVQANDIIYVEPTPDLAREVLRDVTPVISLITATLFLIQLVGSN